MDLVLASTSPWRRRILQDAGVRVECVGSGFDESTVSDDDPVRLALTLAERKAEAVAASRPGAWVIGADQVVFDGRDVFGKPADPGDHLRRLAAMRGRAHDLVTGWVLLGPDGQRHAEHARTTLHVRGDLTEAELAAYVATGEGSECAGGYAAEGLGGFLFERIEGDWFNVLGLPLLDVLGALRRVGWRFEGAA